MSAQRFKEKYCSDRGGLYYYSKSREITALK